MENIQIPNTWDTGEDGRPVLRLVVRGHEVEASFSTERNADLGAQLKQTLFAAYLQTMDTNTAKT